MTDATALPARSPANPRPGPFPDPYDFSVVLGGPLYQLARRTRLSGDALELLRRRLIFIPLFAWLPLLILAVLGGRAWGSAVAVPFALDLAVHVRYLVTLPLLVVAELVVHQRMRPVIRQFLERNLVPQAARAQFDAAAASAVRWRNSVAAEVALLVFVYGLSIFAWPYYGGLQVATWYAEPVNGGRQLTVAGWWFSYVSLPLFQFMLLRWYFRIFIWIRFLWHVSRCPLSLVPTHPDRLAGLGFLSGTVTAFAPLLFAHGTLLAASIAMRIFFQNAALLDFKVELGVVVVFLLVLVLGPLLLFVPQLATARRIGLREYGALAQRYVREFDAKWLRGGVPDGEPLVGSADVQSLADLGGSYEMVQNMRMVPFTRDAALQLGVITLVPVAPLLLTMIPLEELLKRLVQIIL
jgi:hypothetical protein